MKATKAQLRMMVESIPGDDDTEVEVFKDQAGYLVSDLEAVQLAVWGGVLGYGIYARPKVDHVNGITFNGESFGYGEEGSIMSQTTPVLSEHARQQCQAMRISTKVAKRIYRMAQVVRPSMGLFVATCDEHPEYAVLYQETPGERPDVIVTVLFREVEKYVREGRTYTIVSREGES